MAKHPHNCLLTFPSVRQGKNKKSKSRNHSLAKVDSLIIEGKKTLCKSYRSAPPTSWPMSSQSWTVATLKNSICLSPPASFYCLCAGWYRISLWLVLVCSPGCDPCHLPAYPQPIHWGREHSEKQKVLVLFEHCSAIAKMLFCNQHHFDQKSKTSMEAAMKNINSSSARSSKRSCVLIRGWFLHLTVYKARINSSHHNGYNLRQEVSHMSVTVVIMRKVNLCVLVLPFSPKG